MLTKFEFPYATFERGAASWHDLKVKPTKVPKKFIVCVGFDPEQTRGVYVSHDGEGSGASSNGLPGDKPHPFAQGDWLIRVSRLRGPMPPRGPTGAGAGRSLILGSGRVQPVTVMPEKILKSAQLQVDDGPLPPFRRGGQRG